MARQYLRRVSLVLADDADAIEVTDLRVVFRVQQWDLQTPTTCTVRVYNMAEATALRIQKEFDRLVLSAGYEEGPFGKIFDGTLIQVRRGRENAVDSYVDLTASEADEAYAFGVVSSSLAAGATAKDRLDVITKAMKAHGVEKGHEPEDLAAAAPAPRGRVMFGMAADEARTLAADTQSKWWISENRMHLMRQTGVRPGEAAVLTSATGLIGIPEQTINGIEARVLLNPEITIAGAVQIDNASINQAALANGVTSVSENAFLPRIAEDGFYRPVMITHFGDSRGLDWYSDLTCVALDDGVTKGLAARGYS